jgi:hypothetical protein
MAKKVENITREQLKKGILGCLKDIEKNIEPILDRLMERCCKAYLQINIEPACVINYTEHHEHYPEIKDLGADYRGE